MQRKQRTRLAVLAFFMAFWLLGLLTAGDYGPCWDEQDEMDILRMNLWEYARALHLEESAFEKRAREGNGLTISALTPISQSIEQDHGIAAFYPLAGVVMSESLSENARSLWWHMGCWTLFTLGGLRPVRRRAGNGPQPPVCPAWAGHAAAFAPLFRSRALQ